MFQHKRFESSEAGKSGQIDLSVVVPVLNEEGNLEALLNRLSKVLSGESFELIFVDDGSTDGSREIIRGLCRRYGNVRALFFSKNFGHQIALTAGYDHACGRAVITMDADLQHPPEHIPEMITRWRAGADIVFAVRKDGNNLSWFKRVTSRYFYIFLRAISQVDLINGAADFRLLDRKVVDYLAQYRERDRFLRGIISDMGFSRQFVYYDQDDRLTGVSKYSLIKMIRLGIAGVLSFSGFPLKICSMLGFMISLVSFIYAGLIIYDKIHNGAPAGIASILVGVFFIGGIQLIFIGVLGEYLLSVFKETKARPLYCLSEILEPQGVAVVR